MNQTTHDYGFTLEAHIRPTDGNRWAVRFTDVEYGEQLPIYIWTTLAEALAHVGRVLR